MTIHIPKELESSVRALVQGGHYASVDAAMTEAARLLLRQQQAPANTPATEADVLRHMLDTGFITQLANTDADFDDPDDQPIAIQGEPMSETIIRERR
jgi:Arc/MetJ-type ribon-helix-helix transcriptional regulator